MSKNIFKTTLNLIPRPILIQLSFIVRPFLTLWLKGNRYTDPIDNKSFRKFLPYGYAKQRPNVLSPSTLSLERHRLLWLYLQNETNFFKPELVSNSFLKENNEVTSKDSSLSTAIKVLHFAPEQAFYKRFKKMPHLNYTTTDLNSPLADVKADICNLPFADNAFDFILCNHVLEHIPNDTKAMQELYRVMNFGGMGIFQIPQDLNRADTFEDDSITDKAERTKIFGQYDHVRVYGRDYFDKLRAVGFKVEEVDYTKNLSEEDIDRFRLAKGEIIPVVFKLK